MHNFIAIGAALAASVATVVAQNGSTAIQFSGIPQRIRTYQKPQQFQFGGNCPMAAQSYGNGIAPLDEELSMVFRGPISIKQIAVYTEDTTSHSKRTPQPGSHHGNHGHQHFHKHRKEARAEEAKRAVGDEVVATINGQVVSWANNYNGGSSTPTPGPVQQPAASPAVPANAPAAPAAANKNASPSPPAAAPSSALSVSAGTGNFARQAYYNAASATAQGLTFLANNLWAENSAGQTVGNVLGHVASNGVSQANSPTILEDCLIPDNTEIIISSNQACNGGCGATAPMSQAYHGFEGPSKIFIAEYSMPVTGSRSGLNGDKPAFWVLNTGAVNTQQYGACSCWATGCGEFDVHEVLQSGDDHGYASLHMWGNYGGQAPQGVARPMEGTTHKIAAVMTGSTVHVQVLDDGFGFGTEIAGSVVQGWLDDKSVQPFVVDTTLGDAPV